MNYYYEGYDNHVEKMFLDKKANLTIRNYLSKELEYEGYNMYHGRFEMGKYPPAIIPPGGSGFFSVENTSLYGPEGTITYHVKSNGYKLVTITFYWENPMSSNTGRYEIHPDKNVINYHISPPNPTGTIQNVTYDIRGMK